MTAANLGSRVTGWGFVLFTVGSVAWSTVALGTGQTNLLLTNGFLTLVNVVGIWRWLGRQARHEEGSAAAALRSAAARVPNLFGMGMLVGGTLTGRDDTAIGTVIDGMMRCDGGGLAYVVVAEGGVGGVGERLHALRPDQLRFGEQITCDLDAAALSRLPVLAHNDWPAAIDSEIARD
ncbi:PRC-barrel domain containing protein [Sphingomonas oligophenolica]|nr:PRC-barrel domain containing protein [Sphingomonas oligophenolica]